MRPLVKKALVRVVLFIICGCLGGPIFSSIEYREDQNADKKALLKSLNKTMSIKYNMTAQEFDNFTKLSFEALSPAKPSWNIETGVHFAFETITTIGYGDITPVTQLGQTVCIFYSLIGIPITLLALKSVGELIKEALIKLIRNVERRLLKREQISHSEAKCAGLSFFITAAILCIGAVVSMQTSHWTFLEGIYFWFISFTTVGFGDYLPPTGKDLTHESNNTERALIIEFALSIFYSVWFLTGLCMVSSVISSIQDALEKNPYQGMCFGCLARQSYTVDAERKIWTNSSFRVTEQPISNNMELLEMSNPAPKD